MKKLIISVAAVTVMAVSGWVAMHVIGNQTDPIFEANVEALTNGESGSGDWYVNSGDGWVICTPWGDQDC